MERRRALYNVLGAVTLLVLLVLSGLFFSAQAELADFTQKNLSPSLSHPFGTDWMGRDMLARTLSGMVVSLGIGLAASIVSGTISLLLGLCCLIGKRVDAIVCWLIDFIMGVPHLLLLILVSLACGRGFTGVLVGISLTHWPSLARVLRAEGLQLREAIFVQVARKLGQTPLQIARRHFFPHLLPQFTTGLILTFPHAVLHEASITFLGFGIAPEQSSIGILLSESMKYLAMGRWWLAVFPGICLAGVVLLFSFAGDNLRTYLSPVL